MPTPILLVEDNPVARGFLARVVRESFTDAIELTECASLAAGQRAIEAAASRPFRLILCALELVDGSGLELLETLRHYPATRIATTLYSDDEHLFPALQLGADGYLLKEDRFEILVEELQRVVRGQPTMSPAIARRVTSFFRDLQVPRFGRGLALSTAGDTGGDETPTLAARETELLGHLSKGFTLKEISRLTGLRSGAIAEHIRSVYTKLAQASTGLRVAASADLDR
ncbi:MAG: hypothetical protein RL722_1958 [Pseudomonadota bacterium]|jgi:DNA-binding NarL/FixJ family response regulator